MAVSCLAKPFNTGTGSAGSTVDITDAGFNVSGVSAALLFMNGRTEAVDTIGRANHWRGVGFAVSSSDRRAYVGESVDASASAAGSSYHSNAACLLSITGRTTLDGAMDMNSWLSNGLRLIVDTQFPRSYRCGALLFTGLTNAASGQFQTPASAGGTLDINCGFTPDPSNSCVFLLGTCITSTPPAARNDASIMALGVFAADGSQAVLMGGTDEGSATMDCWSYCLDIECLAIGNASWSSNIVDRFSFNSWITNGFRLNVLEAYGTSIHWNHWMVLEGLKSKVVPIATRTDGNDIVTPSLGFTPEGCVVLSAYKAESTQDTQSAHDTKSIGIGDKAGNRFCAAVIDEDGVATSEVTTAIEHDEIYIAIDTSSAVEGLMDTKTWGADTITFVMDDTDPSAKFASVLAVGNVAAGITQSVNQVVETDLAQPITAVVPVVPVVSSSDTSVESANTTTHTVKLPPVVNATELLLVMMSFDGAPAVTWDNISHGTWTPFIDTPNGSNCKLVIYGKVADGTEDGGTLSIGTDASEQSVHRSLAITNWEGTLAGGVNVPSAATGSDDSPDPPNAADSWGTVGRKTIAVFANDFSRTVTAYPTNYTLNQFNDVSGGGAGCGLGSAGYNLSAAGSQDPGVFTIDSADQWVAATISIQAPVSGLSATVNQITETDLAQALGKLKAKTLAQIAETDLAQTITRPQIITINLVVETNLAQSIGILKTLTVGQIAETDLAQALTRLKTALVGQISETDTAQGLSHVKVVTAGQVLETDTAQAMMRVKTVTVAQISEVDLAQTITTTGEIIQPVGQIVETDLAQALTRLKTAVVGQIAEIDLVQALVSVKIRGIGQVLELDLAQALIHVKVNLLGQVVEVDLAQALTRLKTLTVGQTLETDLAQGLIRPLIRLLSQAVESDLAQALASSKLKSTGQALEIDLAQGIGRVKAGVLGQVTETDLAQALARLKTRLLGQVMESDLAQAITWPIVRLVAQITETDIAQPISSSGAILVSQVTETDLAQLLAHLKLKAMGQVTESDLAQALTTVKAHTLGQVSESDLAQTFTIRRIYVISPVAETDLAQALFPQKRVAVAQVIEVDAAQSILIPQTLLVAQVIEFDLAQTIVFTGGAYKGIVGDLLVSEPVLTLASEPLDTLDSELIKTLIS